MRTTLPHTLGRTSVVLGAGATVGTTLRRSKDRPRPPLDTDFFTQIQRLKNPKHKPYIDALLKFCYTEFGPGWTLGMEQFYNYVWYARKFRSPESLMFTIPEARSPLDLESLFKQVLLATFEESLYGFHSQNIFNETCELHDLLAVQMEPNDAVLSFNYDCVMDCSLRQHCPYWRVEQSYAFSPVQNAGLDIWRGSNLEATGTVRLHKLHGSVNWNQEGKKIALKVRPYTRQRGQSRYFIVPPVISKDAVLNDGILSSIWTSASNSLATSESVVVIGYSIPTADALANALFASRASIARPEQQKLKNLVIANPDREIRHRVIRTFRQSIGEATRVLVFNTMEEMSECIFNGENELA